VRAVIAPRDIPKTAFEKLRERPDQAAQSPEFKAMPRNAARRSG